MGPGFELDATNDPRRVTSNARNGSLNGRFAVVILPRSVTGSGRELPVVNVGFGREPEDRLHSRTDLSKVCPMGRIVDIVDVI
jgi:hypothetical protein